MAKVQGHDPEDHYLLSLYCIQGQTQIFTSCIGTGLFICIAVILQLLCFDVRKWTCSVPFHFMHCPGGVLSVCMEVSLLLGPSVPLALIDLFRIWLHSSYDVYQLSLNIV
jgi:hypothetical protein